MKGSGWKKKMRRGLAAACLAVGLTMAGWGGSAVDKAEAAFAQPTIEVSGTISPTTDLTDVYVIYSLNSSGSPDSIYHHEAEDVSGGETGTFSFTVKGNPWYDGESYTVIAVYDENEDGQGDSVCIGGPGISDGNSWDTYFDPETEAEVVDWLQNDNWYALEQFYSDYFDTIAQDIGNDITLWNFSNATYNGTAHADSQVVPIPGAVWLLGSGLIGLVAITRRKPKA